MLKLLDAAPRPHPIRTNADIGAYVFPGCYRTPSTEDHDAPTIDSRSEWPLILSWPQPRPVLGCYDDSLPEVNDWHIYWALEAGIGLFAFDWYWNAGETRLKRTLERGFLNAQYAPMMDFCIHWCNHPVDWRRPLDFTPEALVDMIAYCAEQYFRRRHYRKIGGRPVLMVFDLPAVIEANGGDEPFTRDVLPRLNAVCRTRGLPGLYLVAVYGSHYMARRFRCADALTVYGYSEVTRLYPPSRPAEIPYGEIAEQLPAIWTRLRRIGPELLPSVMSGWDDAPRARGNRLVRTGNTPRRFAEALQLMLQHRHTAPFCMIEAWNEWGEGSCIEPAAPYGFSMLDAVRRCAGSDPVSRRPNIWAAPNASALRRMQVAMDLSPAYVLESLPAAIRPIDVVRNPSRLPTGRRTVIDPCRPDASVTLLHLEAIGREGDRCKLRITGNDPGVLIQTGRLPMEQWRGLAVDGKLTDNRAEIDFGSRVGQLYWSTDKLPLGHHELLFMMQASEPGSPLPVMTWLFTPGSDWPKAGALTALRYDLPSAPGAVVELKLTLITA